MPGGGVGSGGGGGGEGGSTASLQQGLPAAASPQLPIQQGSPAAASWQLPIQHPWHGSGDAAAEVEVATEPAEGHVMAAGQQPRYASQQQLQCVSQQQQYIMQQQQLYIFQQQQSIMQQQQHHYILQQQQFIMQQQQQYVQQQQQYTSQLYAQGALHYPTMQSQPAAWDPHQGQPWGYYPQHPQQLYDGHVQQYGGRYQPPHYPYTQPPHCGQFVGQCEGQQPGQYEEQGQYEQQHEDLLGEHFSAAAAAESVPPLAVPPTAEGPPSLYGLGDPPGPRQRNIPDPHWVPPGAAVPQCAHRVPSLSQPGGRPRASGASQPQEQREQHPVGGQLRRRRGPAFPPLPYAVAAHPAMAAAAPSTAHPPSPARSLQSHSRPSGRRSSSCGSVVKLGSRSLSSAGDESPPRFVSGSMPRSGAKSGPFSVVSSSMGQSLAGQIAGAALGPAAGPATSAGSVAALPSENGLITAVTTAGPVTAAGPVAEPPPVLPSETSPAATAAAGLTAALPPPPENGPMITAVPTPTAAGPSVAALPPADEAVTA